MSKREVGDNWYMLPAPQPPKIPQETLNQIAAATALCIKEIRTAGMRNVGGRPTEAEYNTAIDACVRKLFEINGHKDKL